LEMSKKLIEPIAEILSRQLKWTSEIKKSEILEAEKLVSSLEKHIRS